MTVLLDSTPLQPPQPERRGALEVVRARQYGALALRSLRDSLIDTENMHCGEQVTGLIDIEDRTHFVRVTEARRPSIEGNHTVVMLPGWTEMVDRGAGQGLHDAVARRKPESRVISIATDGVGEFCKPLGWREGWNRTFDTMAADRLEIASFLSPEPEADVTLINVSMGSVLALSMARMNLRQQRVELKQLISHSSAYVPPKNVPRDMVLRFPAHMAVSGIKEGVRHPVEAIENVVAFAKTFATHAPALVGNARNLLHGTNYEHLREVASQGIPMGFVIGEDDPLGQLKHLRQVQADFPDLMRIILLRKRGHACSIDAAGAANHISQLDITNR